MKGDATKRASASGGRWILFGAIGLVAVLVGLGVIITQPSTAGSLATIEVVERSVEVRAADDDSYAEATSSQSLAEGSVVRTDRSGLAAISYSDGSLTRIGPATTYELTTLRTETRRRAIVGKLDSGQTFHRVTRATGSESRFEVQTSSAVASVRGTAFAVQCVVLRICEIAVTEGRVTVRTPDGQEVDVPAGRRVTVDGDGGIGDLRLLSTSDPWLARNAELDETAEDPDTGTADSADDPGVADESGSDGSESTVQDGSAAASPPAPTSTSRSGGTTSTTRRLDFSPTPQPQPDRIDGSEETTTSTTTAEPEPTSTTRQPRTTTSSTTSTTEAPTTTTQRSTTTTRRPGTTSTAPAPTQQSTTTTSAPTTTTEPCENGLPRENGECPVDACEDGESEEGCEPTTTTEGETTTTLRSCTEGPPPCRVPAGGPSSNGWGGWFGLLTMFAAIGGLTYLPSRREPWSE